MIYKVLKRMVKPHDGLKATILKRINSYEFLKLNNLK